MQNKMTPLEAADKMEKQVQYCRATCAGLDDKSFDYAISMLRKIAAIQRVDISAAKIRNWGSCCQNMRAYLQPGGHPLLDTLQSRDGMKIKIYLDNEK